MNCELFQALGSLTQSQQAIRRVTMSRGMISSSDVNRLCDYTSCLERRGQLRLIMRRYGNCNSRVIGENRYVCLSIVCQLWHDQSRFGSGTYFWISNEYRLQ